MDNQQPSQGGKKMSIKITQEAFLQKFQSIYNHTNISIIEWNGYTKPIKFNCDICGNEHYCSDARQLLNKKTYCQKNSNNNIKWDLTEYNERINRSHNEKITILEYNGLSNPVKYLCPICKKIKSCNPARTLITRLSLCDVCYGVERNIIENKIRFLFNQSNDFKLLTWRGCNNKLTEQCLKCGYVYDRYPTNVLQCFNSCPQCNNGAVKQLIDLSMVQQRIDDQFGENQYKLLEYKGQLNKHNKIKCLSCGLIFEAHMVSFIDASRGCPKCKRFKSKGEQLVQQYLENNNIPFESQKRFKDCNNNLSSFDFAVYDSKNKMYLIEINGIQHYKQTTRFGDLEVIQKRDMKKKTYCEEHNIPLIIIPYTELKNIDKYLSFLKGSTTIPEGSRE